MSAISVGCEEAYKTSVDVTCESVDSSIKVNMKMSCILWYLGWRGGGVQLILAYGWARPAILVAGKGRWGMFLFLLFLHFHA